MIPTIQDGNRVLAEKITYARPSPNYGDIACLPDPKGEHPHLISALSRTAGQTSTVRNGHVSSRRGAVEPYHHGLPSARCPTTSSSPCPLARTEDLWVWVTNRRTSGDSRVFGADTAARSKGTAVDYWPLNAFGPWVGQDV